MKNISLLEKENLRCLQPKVSQRQRKKENSGDCVQCTTKGQCSGGDQCGILRKKREYKDKGRVRDCPTLHEGLPQNERPRKGSAWCVSNSG